MKTVQIAVKGLLYPKKTSNTYIIVHCCCLLKKHLMFCCAHSIMQNIAQAIFAPILTLVISLFLNIFSNANYSYPSNTKRISKNNLYKFNNDKTTQRPLEAIMKT